MIRMVRRINHQIMGLYEPFEEHTIVSNHDHWFARQMGLKCKISSYRRGINIRIRIKAAKRSTSVFFSLFFFVLFSEMNIYRRKSDPFFGCYGIERAEVARWRRPKRRSPIK